MFICIPLLSVNLGIRNLSMNIKVIQYNRGYSNPVKPEGQFSAIVRIKLKYVVVIRPKYTTIVTK